ncbi:MAG: ABC transporter transmembrane domain-containing protein [Hyphomicrobiaceae bacterium]
MDRSFFSYVWRYSKWEQSWILMVVLASFPIYFLSLDLPKHIINGPIQGEGFGNATGTATFFNLELSLPWILGGGKLTLFDGVVLDQMNALVTLSLLFLLLVCINGAFKFYMNLYKGRLGERMLRRLRYQLVDRLVRFPIGRFKRIKSAEVASMVKDEVEPLGGFIGDAFVQPVFLAGQALTVMVFIITQNVMLGLIALGIVFLQAIVIPRLRRPLLELGRQRQIAARQFAGRVGEVVDGMSDVRTNDATNYERADAADRLGQIYFIRYNFYFRKFAIKFLNNFLALVTPFLFYLVGGIFAIKGELDIGQLVAVIAAYKDLPGPIKELIDWDQNRLNAELKYGQVFENFSVDGIVPLERQSASDGDIKRITSAVKAEHLSVEDESGAQLLNDVSFTIAPAERLAVVGPTNSGGETAAEALARLVEPTSGTIKINDAELFELPESASARRIGYVSSQPFFHDATLRENLTYSLCFRPRARADESGDIARLEKEAEASGNTVLRRDMDWIDYGAAGVRDEAEFESCIYDVLAAVELLDDVYQLGLRSKLGTDTEQEVIDNLLRCRAALRGKLQSEEELQRLIEPLDVAAYNRQLSISENLLFGSAIDAAYAPDQLATNETLRAVMADTGVDREIFSIGREIAETIVELFSDLAPDHPFIARLSFVDISELPQLSALLSKLDAGVPEELNTDLAASFIRLAFDYIEPQHRLGLLTPELSDRILIARAKLRTRLGSEADTVIDFFDEASFNTAMSVEENLLFGRPMYGIADGPERVRKELTHQLDELDMGHLIISLGLGYGVGSGGRRLNTAQRQKLAVARAMLKRPDLLIVNDGLSNLDPTSFERILKRILDFAKEGWRGQKFATFWVLSSNARAAYFDRTIEFENGRIQSAGAPNRNVAAE